MEGFLGVPGKVQPDLTWRLPDLRHAYLGGADRAS
ncbi:hypothetical protein QF030_000291 [Streptomyces rishiriensis]|uniref:Uncharacterized protein n=1 Tax=Streptomyces rishiriensis TaxID=68264 RepID=A0ABU0NH21_STRRH|nr:hypothetical protein [Streptomyces rishiriensis]